MIAGKNLTSFTTAEEANYASADVPFDLQSALTKQGAKFHEAKPWSSNTIDDGNLVSGQNPASARDVAKKMIELLSVN